MDHTGTTTERADALRRALREIAGNLAFSWHDDARAIFERLDPEAYERSGHSPIAVVQQLADAALARAADDAALVAEVERIRRELAAEATPAGTQEGLQVAYFCAEFGIDESLPI
jgi:starch phosphorylase